MQVRYSIPYVYIRTIIISYMYCSDSLTVKKTIQSSDLETQRVLYMYTPP